MWSYDILFCNDLCNVTGFGGIAVLSGWVGRPGGGTQCLKEAAAAAEFSMARQQRESPPAKTNGRGM